MLKDKIYIFDLDNTLVYTNELNNESYNYALVKLGKNRIDDVERINRKIVYKKCNLTDEEKQKIVNIKQKYFIENINKIIINDKLIKKLKLIDPNNCVLWTSSEKVRAEAILNFLDIKNNFSKVYYSEKEDYKNDIKTICNMLNCKLKNIVLYDDKVKI